MTQTARFFDAISYTELDQSDFNMRLMRPQGVLPDSVLGFLTVSAIGSMAVRIGPGEAFIQGFQYKNDADVDLTIGPNSSGSTRVDTVVLSLNRTSNLLILLVKAGTPGAGAPTLTQIAGGNWEFPLANISVPNAAISIVSGNIADVRIFSRWPVTTVDPLLALDSNVTDEANARIAADTAEATTRAAADTAETTARTTADTNIAKAASRSFGRVAQDPGGATLLHGNGVASVVRQALGVCRVTWSVAFTHADYIVVFGAQGANVKLQAGAQTTTYIDVYRYDASNSLADGNFMFATFSFT